MDELGTAALVIGYTAAVPFTLFLPGFLRLWRRRERWTYGLAQGGAVLIVVGWATRGATPAVLVNAAWAVGLALAYAAEGRKRRLHG